jgi:protein-disulfide isomerase
MTVYKKRFLLIGISLLAIAVSGCGVLFGSLAPDDPFSDSVEPSRLDVQQSRTDDGAFIIGDPDAPVTIVEFADFLCPHCQAYEPTIQQFVSEYVVTGQAKLEFRMLAVFGEPSYVVFGLAECAATRMDDDFWTVHNELFRITSGGVRDVNDVAQQLGNALDLSAAGLLECAATVDQYVTDLPLAVSAGVTGTPGVRVRIGDGEIETPEGWESGGPAFQVLAAFVEDTIGKNA